MTEAELQQAVIDLARWNKWRVFHARSSLSAAGRHLTAFQGDPGLPDLILARRGQVVLWELKRQTGWRWQPGQREWLTELGTHGRLIQPKDWDFVVATLTARTGETK